MHHTDDIYRRTDAGQTIYGALRAATWWAASAALAATGALPENVNYAVKSSLLLSFVESVPEMAAKQK